MRTSETRGPIASPITYEVAKRFLQLDHDGWKADISDALVEIVDELELSTNAVISPRSCTITFHDESATYTVPSIVTAITSVLDADDQPVAHLTQWNGTTAIITPLTTGALPITVTYEGGDIRPIVRRAVKEMLAHKLRYRGDEAAEYPASIQRVIRQLTNVRL